MSRIVSGSGRRGPGVLLDSSTIGSYIVFPSQKVGNKATINGARGMHHKVRDRFDLTLKCIRRYYQGQDSPLRETLARYDAFFKLFNDFSGYV